MKVDIKKHIFLGIQELTRLFKFQGNGYTNGLFKSTVESYGVVKRDSDLAFDALKVVQGSAINTITISEGNAVLLDGNADAQLITVGSEGLNALSVPNDSTDHYVVLNYSTTKNEEGLVFISASGAMTGVGTQFNEVLRSLPDFPTKVTFPTATSNTGEYIVSNVNSDTSVSLNANTMTLEGPMHYRVASHATHGSNLSLDDRTIYNRPSYTVELRSSDTVITDQEIVLATVSYDGASITITDRRSEGILTNVDASVLSTSTNSEAIVGVEIAQYDHEKSDLGISRVKVGWGANVLDANWSANTSTNSIAITDVFGGAWVSGAPFATNDFNGWRCYFADGTYLKVLTSTKNGANGIDLTFSDYPTTFATSGDVVIVPDADGIEVTAEPSDFNATFIGNGRIKEWFPINSRVGNLNLAAESTYTLKYKLTRGEFTSAQYTVNATAGVYGNENSFNADGTLNTYTPTAISSGSITTLISANNHHSAKAWVNQDNVFTGGVNSETTGTDGNYTSPSILLAGDANYYNVSMDGSDVKYISDIGEVGCEITLNLTPTSGAVVYANLFNQFGSTPAGYLDILSQVDNETGTYARYASLNTITLRKVAIGATNYWAVMSVNKKHDSQWQFHNIVQGDITVTADTGTGSLSLVTASAKTHTMGSLTNMTMDLEFDISAGYSVETFTISNLPVAGRGIDFSTNGAIFSVGNGALDANRFYKATINGTTMTFHSIPSTPILQPGSGWHLNQIFTYENDL